MEATQRPVIKIGPVKIVVFNAIILNIINITFVLPSHKTLAPILTLILIKQVLLCHEPVPGIYRKLDGTPYNSTECIY